MPRAEKQKSKPVTDSDPCGKNEWYGLSDFSDYDDNENGSNKYFKQSQMDLTKAQKIFNEAAVSSKRQPDVRLKCPNKSTIRIFWGMCMKVNLNLKKVGQYRLH